MVNTIQNKLLEALKKYNSKTAVEYNEQKVTYKEIDHRSETIKDVLVAKGIPQKTPVGILLDNKVEMITAMIGILKAGCIFVPLDENYQNTRLKIMSECAELKYIITDKRSEDRAEMILSQKEGIIIVSDNEDKQFDSEHINYDPKDPIYIFFTSGTTGKPKAILGKNESLLNFVEWEGKYLGNIENLRVSQLTSPGFDAVMRDIFTTLCHGGTICIPEKREVILDGKRLGDWIERSEVNVIHCTPTLFRLIDEARNGKERYEKLKYVMMAGERIIPKSLKDWYEKQGEKVQLVNFYGPSETTMIKTYYEIKASDTNKSSISIGKPMEGTRIHILDRNMKECMDNEEGEIYIETEYMTLGYYNNEEMTKEKFVKINIEETEKLMYRTGDYGKIMPDGNLEYIGRKDRQVKIRGNRIELGEIEGTMLTYPGVKESLVHVEEEQEKAKYCSRCGITSKYEGVIIGEDGVCNVCKKYEGYEDITAEYFRPLEELEQKLKNNPYEGKYDCLLQYSGGKDSTYVLYKLVEMGVRVLAFVFDNEYISETAFKNIDRVVKECNVDCIIQTQKDMNKVFLEGLNEECSVCKGCFRVLNILSERYAYENKIPYIINGLSRGQIFDVRLYDIFEQGKQIEDVEEIENKIFEQRCLYHAKKDYVTKSLGEEMIIDREILEKTEVIDFYRYTDVTKKEILDLLKSKSDHWSQPQDTGSCSSNCRVNDVGIYVQRKRKEYDNYTFPNSWEVRLGHITLEQSLEELAEEVDKTKIVEIMEEIGYEDRLEKEDRKKTIAGYYISDERIEENELYEYLRERLPAYEVPSKVMQIEKIPINMNGKIDYEKLPKIGDMQLKKSVAYRDEIELKLAEIWSEILETDNFDRDDNFLAIGGHSLKVMTMISMIVDYFDVELPLEVVFNDAVISKIADYIRNNANEDTDEIKPVEKKEYYRVTSEQLGFYMQEQLKDCLTGNNIATVIDIKGSVDAVRLEDAIRKMLYRHDIFRTSFDVINEEILQIVHDDVPFKLNIVTEENYDIGDYVKPFDLQKAPLIRATLFQNENSTKLLLDSHHTVGDGLSVMIMINELAALYEGRNMEELYIQYKDFAQWKADHKESIDTTEENEYWKKNFENYNPQKGKIDGFNPEETEVYAGNDIDEIITDTTLLNRLNKVAKDNRTTLFMVYFSAFNVVYSRYTASEDVVIGTPLHGRNYGGLSDMIGTFANGVPLRNYPYGNKTFAEFMDDVKKTLIGAINNQEYHVNEVIQDLTSGQYHNTSYLFDTVFTMFILDRELVESDNITLEYEDDKTTVETQKMRVIVKILPDKTNIKIKYACDHLEKNMICRMMEDYKKVLEVISQNDSIKIEDISLDMDIVQDTKIIEADVDFDF
ncbi:non-ribosomal peptide synthetase [Vallitalea guaymasensis]|uniref:non-ribosomal peptide synthetase n=1 Tax=Vallitalea guaymasensis TaxID=1185412 RepID=UPI00187D1E68|nr:non-ribosomal peptide synthetase [Vallitalea guaymasensis]